MASNLPPEEGNKNREADPHQQNPESDPKPQPAPAEPSMSLLEWIVAIVGFVAINVALYKGTRWYLRRRWLDGV